MSSTERIRVMVADDHPIMRNGLREALDGEEDFEVVGQASDGVEAVRMAQRVEPDVIVMDVMMPGKDGVDACREIMEELPNVQVLMLTASTAEDAVIEAVAAGATGYLQKHSGPEELAVAIRDLAQGKLRIPDRYIRRVFAMIRGQRGLGAGRGLESITDREREILRLFAEGKSYAQIAEAGATRPRPSRTPSTASRRSWGSSPSRSSWSGPCATACWMKRSRRDERRKGQGDSSFR